MIIRTFELVNFYYLNSSIFGLRRIEPCNYRILSMIRSILITVLVVLIITDSPIGTVVDGNVNIGKNNTILSAGNYVKGSGNIVVPLDSSFDPFKGDPFFDSPLPSFTPTPTRGGLTINSHTPYADIPKVIPPQSPTENVAYTAHKPDVRAVPVHVIQSQAEPNSKKYEQALRLFAIILIVLGVSLL